MDRALLEKHFTAEQIKQRQGNHGEVLEYLEGAVVIQRLNDAFAGEWSFETMEHLIQEKEVLVLGKLTAGGITKTQFGNKGREDSVGDDLKAATTDCIKKCATLFGIGLHLYFDGKTAAAHAQGQPPQPAPYPERTYVTAPPPAPPSQYRDAGNGHNGNNGEHGNGGNGNDGRLSNRQLSAIFGIAKGEKGWSNKQTREESQERFGKLPDHLTKAQASAFIDSLKGGRR